MLEKIYEEFNKDSKTVSMYWTDHKNQVELLIDKALHASSPSENAIILGAGNGDDLPLTKIIDFFGQTTLLDVDENTLKYTVQALPLKYRDKTQLLSIDLNNADQKLVNQYINYLSYEQPNMALVTLQKLISDRKLFPNKLCDQNFDLVISSTISTQLASAFTIFAEVLGGNLKNELLIIGETFGTKAAENHVNQIYNLLSDGKDSVAIIVSEQFVWSDEFLEQKLIKNIMSKPEDMLLESNQKLFEEAKIYINGRITESMLSKFQIIFKAQWIWQFNEKRHYLVKGWIVKK